MTKICGIYAASMSVFNSDLSLNAQKTILHAERLIEQGCHGTAIFGSTGQSQLISVSEKIKLLNELSQSKYKSKHIIGTGLNSLNDTINLMKVALSLNFENFLIMPPAYYNYEDQEVIRFITKIVDTVPESRIILYNFEKLSGYKFSPVCIKELKKRFPDQIIGVKDSTYNLFESLELENFSIFPGSETKLLKGLELGCSGIITATCNVTARLSRKVYDDFFLKKPHMYDKKLCDVRNVFEKYNLISALHSFFSQEEDIYKNILPPLRLLNSKEEEELLNNLKSLNFKLGSELAA